jgi:hypothetical protein
MFPHYNIYKYTWTATDEKTHNQIDHVLVNNEMAFMYVWCPNF